MATQFNPKDPSQLPSFKGKTEQELRDLLGTGYTFRFIHPGGAISMELRARNDLSVWLDDDGKVKSIT